MFGGNEILLMSEISIGKRKLRLVRGDITERLVDAIVNTANSNLYHGGGVAAAIVAKGEGIIQEESDKIGYLPTGNVVITNAGKLPCKAVIHVVGPRNGEGKENEKLTLAINNILKLAQQNNSKAYLFQLLAQEYLDSLNKSAQRYWFKNLSTLLKGKIPITPFQKSLSFVFLMMKHFSILRESLIMPKIGKKNYNTCICLQFQSIASSRHETRKEQILN